jgi:hypothetical protein
MGGKRSQRKKSQTTEMELFGAVTGCIQRDNRGDIRIKFKVKNLNEMVEEVDWDDQGKDREIGWRCNRCLSLICEGEEEETGRRYCELTSAINGSKS